MKNIVIMTVLASMLAFPVLAAETPKTPTKQSIHKHYKYHNQGYKAGKHAHRKHKRHH